MAELVIYDNLLIAIVYFSKIYIRLGVLGKKNCFIDCNVAPCSGENMKYILLAEQQT